MTQPGEKADEVGEDSPVAVLPGDPEAPTSSHEDAEPTSDRSSADAGSATVAEDDTTDAVMGHGRRPTVRGVLTFSGGVLAGAVVVALIAAFVWPGHLFGPGSPDGVAAQATAAFGAKDAAALDRISCRGPNGAPVAPVGADVLNVVSAAKPAGPTTITMQTEAQAPVDLTISYQGQSQPLPINLVLGESDGGWCFKAISQRS